MIKNYYIGIVSLNYICVGKQWRNFTFKIVICVGEVRVELNSHLVMRNRFLILPLSNQIEIDKYKELVKKTPNDADAHFNLGEEFFKADKFKEAIEPFNEVLRINPDNAEAHFYLGRSYRVQKDYVKAVDHLNRATSINKALGDPFLYLAYIAREVDKDETKAKKYAEKARRLLEEALKKDNSNHKTHEFLGVTYTFFKRYDDAIASYKEAIRINPDYADAHYSLGLVYATQDQHQKAINSYKEAIRLNPDNSRAQTNLGYAYSKLSRYQDAITHFEKALRIKPNSDRAHYGMSAAYYNQKQYRKAYSLLQGSDTTGWSIRGFLSGMSFIFHEIKSSV